MGFTFATATTLAGAGVGAILGCTGGLLPLQARIVIATVLSVVATGLATSELAGRAIPMLQCDRETPRNWVASGPWLWAAKNGAALGSGMVSRIGFPSWYVVPLSVLLIGDPVLGGAIFGAYGLVRGASAWLYIAAAAIAQRRGPVNFDDIAVFALRLYPAARVVSAVHLLAVGVAVAFAIG